MGYGETYGNAELAFAQAIADEFVAQGLGVKGSIYTPPERLTYSNLGSSPQDVVKASKGSIFALTIYNTAISTRWIQLFDRNTTINNGDPPQETYPVFAGSFLILDSNYFGDRGLNFENGITFGFSEIGNSYSPTSDSFQLHLKYT